MEEGAASLSMAAPAALGQIAAASAGATPSAPVGAAPSTAVAGVHYEFRESRRALVLLSATATKHSCKQSNCKGPCAKSNQWYPEYGQLQDLKRLRDQCEACGFVVVGELGMNDDEKPTADDVRNFVKDISQRDFNEYDGLMIVIASHGHEGHIWAWPNPSEDQKSGPVSLRDEIYSLFCQPPVGPGTLASKTLVGKPKVFLVDACRGAWGDGVTHLEDPQRPSAAKGARGTYNGLKAGDYHTPHYAPDGTPVLGESDCCFGWATVAFNSAGITNNNSLYLSEVVKQLRENPHRSPPLPLVPMLELANGEMQRQYSGAGRVARDGYPQCSEVKSTLRKVLYFDVPQPEAESGMPLLRDLLHAAEQKGGPELGAEMLKALHVLVGADTERQRAKKARTRGGNERAVAFDMSALFESVKKIAQLVAGPSESTGAVEAALQAACTALGQKADGAVMGFLAPLRCELDALAQLPYDAPPQLTVTAPCEQQQQLSRSAVRHDIAVEDDEDSRWTSIPAGQKLRLQMRCEQNGFCYLLHLNNEDQLSIIFPNKKNADNAVLAPGSDLEVQTRFKNVQHLERETFYLLTISKKLEEFEAVGTLPALPEMLQGRQAQAVLAALRRVAGTAAATVRDLDAGVFAMDSEDSDLTMALSTMTLISESATGAQV